MVVGVPVGLFIGYLGVMTVCLLRLLAISLLLLNFLYCPSADARAQKVLVLHSYHQGLEWTDNVSAGIQSVFNQQGREIEVYYEYLDTKRNHSVDYSKKLLELFRAKEQSEQFELIIASDNNALRFLQLHGEQFYPNTPVVFCGINFFHQDLIQGIPQVTGVLEQPDITGTLELMLQIQPKTEKVLFLLDQTTTAKAMHSSIRDIRAAFADRLQIEFYSDFSWENITEDMAAVAPGTLIYLLSIMRDRDNKYVSYHDGVELISQAAQVPVLGSWDFYLGKGVLGGIVTSGFAQGEAAARMAVQILQGRPASSIAIKQDVLNQVIFDFTQMQRFGLTVKQLPANAKVINQPDSLFVTVSAYSGWILLALLLTISIMAYHLITQRIRQTIMVKANHELDLKVAQKTTQLNLMNRKLNTLINTLPTPVYQSSVEGRIEACNDAFALSVLGLSKASVVGCCEKALASKVAPEVLRSLNLFDQNFCADGKAKQYEQRVLSVNGEARDYIFHTAATMDMQGNLSGCITAMMDVSEQRHAQREREQLIYELEQVNTKLNQLAIMDSVTGTYNRRHISRRLSEELKSAQRHITPFSIMMLDIDHFKTVNDKYGHQVGDEVLNGIAQTIQQTLRAEDTLGRYGGEEFLLLMPRTSMEEARVLAERIRRQVESLSWSYKGLKMTVSVGIAGYTGQSEFELIHAADSCLYAAKSAGRNVIWG